MRCTVKCDARWNMKKQRILRDRCSALATFFPGVANVAAVDQLARRRDHAAEASVEASP